MYVVFLPVWWYSLDALTVLWSTGADVLYGIFDSRTTIEPNGKTINIFVTIEGVTHSSALKVDATTYGLPLLLALVIVTPGTLRSRLKALVVGLLVMFLVTVPAVMLWAKVTSLELEEQLAASVLDRGTRSQFFFYAFNGYAFSQPVVAVVIWLGLMMLGVFKPPGAQASRPHDSRR